MADTTGHRHALIGCYGRHRSKIAENKSSIHRKTKKASPLEVKSWRMFDGSKWVDCPGASVVRASAVRRSDVAVRIYLVYLMSHIAQAGVLSNWLSYMAQRCRAGHAPIGCYMANTTGQGTLQLAGIWPTPQARAHAQIACYMANPTG